MDKDLINLFGFETFFEIRKLFSDWPFSASVIIGSTSSDKLKCTAKNIDSKNYNYLSFKSDKNSVTVPY